MKYLCFTANVTTLIPHFPPSDYSKQLHKKIKQLQKTGLGYRKIAQWLNENGYKTPRGVEFKNTHVFSILKKSRLRTERYKRFVGEQLQRHKPTNLWKLILDL